MNLGVPWLDKKNTELQSLGGLEKVEMMMMRRRLRWLSHMDTMDVSWLSKCLQVRGPVRGKRSVGGQKRKVNSDRKRGDLLEDWEKITHNRGAWRCLVKEALFNICEYVEIVEKEQDERKRNRKDASPESHPGCVKRLDVSFAVRQGLTCSTMCARDMHGKKARVMETCLAS